MALAGTKSKEERKKRREQQRESLASAYVTVKKSFLPILERYVRTHGHAAGDRLLNKLMVLETMAFQTKDPPEHFRENMKRVIAGEEPLPVPKPDPIPEPRDPLLDPATGRGWKHKIGQRRLGLHRRHHVRHRA